MATQQESKQGGRIVKRWVATCSVVEFDKYDRKQECGFNARQKPTLHLTSEAALRESIAHVRTQHAITRWTRGTDGMSASSHKAESLRACRVCRCTDAHPCENGCSWVRDPEFMGSALCSRCLPLREIECALHEAMRRDRSITVTGLFAAVLPEGTWTSQDDETFANAIIVAAARAR